jgi:hypothetical protein
MNGAAATASLDWVRRACDPDPHVRHTTTDEHDVQVLLMGLLTTEGPRDHSTDPDTDSHSIVRSYLMMRVVIGVMGLLLPALLIIGEVFLDGSLKARGSLSAYYHSGMRDEFVGILVVSGVFLITYKIFKINAGLENTLSTLAGVAAILVAIFPTGRPDSSVPLTPLQDTVHENRVEVIHFLSALAFIVLLAGISMCFGFREGRRKPKPDQRYTPEQWRLFHFACAGLIFAALIFIGVTKALGVFDHYRLLVGETVAVVAFGISWLTKGWERDLLFARDTIPTAPDGGVAAA